MLFSINKKMITLAVVTIFFVVLDRLFKSLAVGGYFTPAVPLINDFFKLDFSANYDIALSLPLNGWLVYLLIFPTIGWLIYFFVSSLKRGDGYDAVFSFAIVSAAMSNLADRFKYGYVIDYLNLKYCFVFNIADFLIVIGVIFLFLKQFQRK